MWCYQFQKMQYIADKYGWTKFASMQNQYSLCVSLFLSHEYPTTEVPIRDCSAAKEEREMNRRQLDSWASLPQPSGPPLGLENNSRLKLQRTTRYSGHDRL